MLRVTNFNEALSRNVCMRVYNYILTTINTTDAVSDAVLDISP